MVRYILAGIVFFFAYSVQSFPAIAQDIQTPFARYMLEWRQKSQIAEEYLRKGEDELKKGQKYRACINNKYASQYGVEAYQALIHAQQYDEADKELQSIEDNLDKWKSLANCNTANSLFY